MPSLSSDQNQGQNQDAVLAFLGDPRSHGGDAVQRIDTHAAMVFLAGASAFKLKRAVRYPYLDYSTVDKREAACRAELTINRRTAPALYHDVRAIRRGPDGGLVMDGDGRHADGAAVDWVVAMRRFPDEALFDRMADRNALTPAIMRDLADRIAAFHAAADIRHDGGGVAAMRAVVDGNLDEMAASPALFPPDRLGRLAARSADTLSRLKPLLGERRRGGFVRHCHGDLHLRNIVLLDGVPTLFDAIEFDESLAIIDLFYDLAFLLVDLEQRGLRPLGNAVLNQYLLDTGDVGGLAALPLFLSARAAVRAKVTAASAGLSAGKTGVSGTADLAVEARRWLDQAIAALEPPPPRLIALGGLSGSGKSLLAQALAPDVGAAPGAVILRSDALRKHLWGVAATDRLPPEAYGPAVTERVYAMLLDQARTALHAGHAVVIDAVNATPGERDAFEALAVAASVRFDGIWLDTPLALRSLRVTNRRNDASDATVEVVKRQERYDLGAMRWTRLDAGRVAADVLVQARATLA